MRAKTRIFGEIDIPQDKIITMEKGMIGFPELKNYTLIFNSEKQNDKKSIMWLQSMDDGDIAFPVMTPDIIMPDYKPYVNAYQSSLTAASKANSQTLLDYL